MTDSVDRSPWRLEPGGRRPLGGVAAVVAAASLWMMSGPGPGTGRTPDPAEESVVDAVAALEAALPAQAGLGGGDPGYRLRIRGLHPLVSEARDAPARVEIGATLDRGRPDRLVIEARLLDEASGRVLWERTYRREGGGRDGIREVVGEALRDAMRLTREGAPGDGRSI